MSTDEREAAHHARMERLDELARRVWPEQGATVRWDAMYDIAKVLNERGTIFYECQHPRELDALEAALLVMAADAEHGDAMLRVLRESNSIESLIARSSLGAAVARMKADPEAELARVEAELTDEVMDAIREANGEPSAWTEQLAREWEEDCADLRALALNPVHAKDAAFARGAAASRGKCAAELRERAKEG